jgi:hypothetical protein
VAASTFDIGVIEHLGASNGGTPSLINFYDVNGITSFRTGISWREVELQKGQHAISGALDAFLLGAKASGKEPLFVLCCGNEFYDGGGLPTSAAAQDAFAQYAAFVARHYKGAITRYEVWNEWDIGGGISSHPRGDPIVYTNLLKKVYRALKAVDPNIKVIAGATSGRDLDFADTVFKNGGLTAMDIWSAHPYVYPDPPENAMHGLDTIQEIAKRYTSGSEIPIIASEIGWPTYVGPAGISESQAAAYVARVYLLAPMRSYLKAVYWYGRKDSGQDPANAFHHFGLTRIDNSWKPSVCAMKQISELHGSYHAVSATRDTRGVWITKYSNGTNSVFAVWTQDASAAIHTTVSTSSPSGTRISATGVCANISVAGSGTTFLSADITNSPILFTTTAENLVLQ